MLSNYRSNNYLQQTSSWYPSDGGNDRSTITLRKLLLCSLHSEPAKKGTETLHLPLICGYLTIVDFFSSLCDLKKKNLRREEKFAARK